MRVFFESVFDLIYLTSVIYIGFKLFRGANSKSMILFGVMALVLGIGDSFHLIPRVIALVSGNGFEYYAPYLGIGKFITSITMTIFYVILYYVYRERYKVVGQNNLTMAIYFLALLRIVICLFSQNEWLNYRQPLSWGIYRNIPFLILGMVIIWLFYTASKKYNDTSYKNMWLTIVLSFGFYLPVVLFAGVNETVGLLMIPKTMAYVWTILIGYFDFMKGDKNEKVN